MDEADRMVHLGFEVDLTFILDALPSETMEGEDRGDRQAFGVCVLDSATSEFNLSAFEDDVCRTKLETLLRQLRPNEVIFTKAGRHLFVDASVLTRLAGKPLRVHLAPLEGHPPRQLSLDESPG